MSILTDAAPLRAITTLTIPELAAEIARLCRLRDERPDDVQTSGRTARRLAEIGAEIAYRETLSVLDERPEFDDDGDPVEQTVAAGTVTGTATALSADASRVLALLADHAHHYDGVTHWWDTEHGTVAWTCADHDAIPELTDAGLLIGHRPTDLGCQVAAHLAQIAELDAWLAGRAA